MSWWQTSEAGDDRLQRRGGCRQPGTPTRGRITTYARFPPFHCRSSVAVSPFCRRKIPFFCKKLCKKIAFCYSRKRQKATIRSGNGNGIRKRQRLTGTAKRQRKNGNGMVETGHDAQGTPVRRSLVAGQEASATDAARLAQRIVTFVLNCTIKITLLTYLEAVPFYLLSYVFFF